VKTTIIMPTIHIPPNLVEWADQLDPETDSIIVVGSGISPHEQIEKRLETLPIEAYYQRPDCDYVQSLRINKYMELNHHHRRNFGLLQALENGADMIVTIDDDNYPASRNWMTQVREMLTQPNTDRKIRYNANGWADPGQLCVPRTTHRGYPLSRRHDAPRWTMLPPDNDKIGIFASLWVGDPDIDAIERIANEPTITNVVGSFLWDIGTWAPFDSQSTAITRELAPLLFMWPFVGRYDDIWASYLARAVMDFNKVHVAYGVPNVRQLRNPHNLLKDLDTERLGYEFTEELCDVLRGIDFTHAGTDIVSQMSLAVDAIGSQCRFIPVNTLHGLHAWLADIDDRVSDL
jgi:hypothetical protein